ncbi:ionotropic receptor 25a-like [Coccinella septempunctata]|uniref:ionotropic receptor 25a-like n=1 Tax=Coccinella septempunctata TaxID=41139 RepID=UPI001D0787F2|nr:ionotropic receptor 25a-like [Coccinella septempunctata]
MTFQEANTQMELSQYSVWTYPISGRYTSIWTSMMAAGLPRTMDEVLARIRKSTSPTDGFVFIGDATDCRYLELTNCDLQTIGEEFSSKPYAIVVPQGSPLKKRLDFAIMQLMNNRVLEKLETKWWRNNPAIKKCGEAENQFDGIGLRDIGGVFILILLGIGGATIILTIEFCSFRHIKRSIALRNKLERDNN